VKLRARGVAENLLRTGPRRREVLRALGALVLGGWLLPRGFAAAAEPVKVLWREKIPRDGLITARVTIGGREHLMCVDTGTDAVCFDPWLRGLLRGEGREVKATLFQGEDTLRGFEGPSIKVQGLVLHEPLVVLYDLSEHTQKWGRTLEGIIGMEMLRQGKLLLNFEESVAEVHTGPWRLEAAQGKVIRLDPNSQMPTFAAEISGRFFSCIVDTGYSGCIALPETIFDALVEKGWIEAGKSRWSHSVLDEISGWFLQGELMGKPLAGVTVKRIANDSGPVGLQWLRGFNTEIDLNVRTMRASVLKKAPSPVMIDYTLGADLIFEKGGARVDSLLGGGSAEAAGLAVGDVLVRFGDLEVGKIDYPALASAVRVSAGQAVPVKFLRKSDGVPVEATLKLGPLAEAWNFGGREKGPVKVP
jgi:hypothetical protein